MSLRKKIEKIRCGKCNEWLPKEKFFIRKDTGRHRGNCKACHAKTNRDLRKSCPWIGHNTSARSRCRVASHPNYAKYGGVGIKFELTAEETKKIWFRDKAYLLKNPSIDRIDPKGHYVFDNVRFIELAENSSIANKGTKRTWATSKYNGVVSYRGRWRSQIVVNKKTVHFGFFDTEKEAAKRSEFVFGELKNGKSVEEIRNGLGILQYTLKNIEGEK